MIIGARFIPAGAGNMSSIPSATEKLAVYPRWRGEHLTILPVAESTTGLSPLARGTFRFVGSSSVDLRFIPAGAGNITPAIWLALA